MARYRKVQTAMWADRKFRELTRPQPNGQSLWQYLLTCPESTAIPGVIIAGRAGLAESLDWSPEAFDQAFAEVSSRDMAKADWKARLIWLPKGLDHNGPESPNVVRMWGSHWSEVPQCELKTEIYSALKAFVETLGEGFRKAFKEAFDKDYALSVAGTGTGTGEEGSSPAGTVKPCPHQEIVDLFHADLPTLPRVRVWTEARKKFLAGRWREDPARQDLGWWKQFFAYVAKSDFLCGRSEPTGDRKGQPPFMADLEWIVRPSNFVKILEGKYENRGPGK